MTEEEVTIAIIGHNKEIGSLKHRVDRCENQQESINSLALSVSKLANNMERMADEQKKQGERLLRLEQAPVADFQYYKRVIISAVLSLIAGGIVGAILALIIK